MVADGVLKARRHKGFHHHGAGTVGVIDDAQVRHAHAAVPRQQGADLVAGQQVHFPIFPANGHTHAVRVRVRGDDDVRAGSVRLLNGQGQGRRVFRVGGGHRREAAVLHVLRRHGLHVAAQFLQQGNDDMAARAVEVGVNDFGAALAEELRTEQHGFQAVHVDTVKGGVQHVKGAAPVFRQRFIFLRGQGVHFLNHGLVMRRHQLGSVVEIGLEAVVVGGVVAGGQHHAGIRIEFTDGEGNFRGGPGAVEQVNVTA